MFGVVEEASVPLPAQRRSGAWGDGPPGVWLADGSLRQDLAFREEWFESCAARELAGHMVSQMNVEDILRELRRWPRFMHNVAAWRRLPARDAQYARTPQGLHPRVRSALEERGIEHLFTHQAQAVEAALQKQNVVVVTPTASGKTLCYTLPILDALIRVPDSTALYLFPTKALAHDQLDELRGWLGAVDKGIGAGTYDGDTSPRARAQIRSHARVVLTNPDMLHVGILPHHTDWARFFAGLRYVVLDEVHTYRGVFGSHVGNVMRRLRRVCHFHGSRPQFISTSATIANPREHTERLIEAPVTHISQNGAPRGYRHLVFYNPPIVNRRLGIRRSPILEARMIAQRFLGAGLQTIVFTRSRLFTEILLRYLRQVVDDEVRGYRSGYLPAERREIERGLREGQVRGVVATDALELGIDIGQLSACVMAGYPGTITSTWQQAGRAGRTTDTSVAVLVAAPSPLDQYLMRHPRFFFGRSPEHALINPDNLMILLAHLRCAAFELPLEEEEAFGDSEITGALLAFLCEEGVLHRAGQAYHWMGQTYPASEISLRTATSDRFLIRAVEDDVGRVIGTVDRLGVPLLLYEGAVYLHEGQQYLVETLDWEGQQARVRAVEVDYYTMSNLSEKVQVIASQEEVVGEALTRAYGEATVTVRATSFRQLQLYTHQALGWQEIDLPEQTLTTTAYWIRLSKETVDRLVRGGVLEHRPGDRGPNWAQQRDRARARDEYLCQHCGAAERPGRQHDVHHLRRFRSFGWLAGQNANYRAANALDNLITLCPSCHQRTEMSQRAQSALAGLAHVMRHIAPLYLMCDREDIGVVAESRARDTGQPTLYVYDRMPAGLGFSQELFARHAQLLQAAREVIESCPCKEGCPACVGPAAENGSGAKEETAWLIALLSDDERRN
jgi:DEAD/DEAH box helicase domain-containing protein